MDAEVRVLRPDLLTGLTEVTAYRSDVGEVTLTVMSILVDSDGFKRAIEAALDRKLADIDVTRR